MSTDDYLVDPLRDSEVREHAKTLRRFLGLADTERVDPLLLEATTEIWTVSGVKPFLLETVSDAALPHDSGLTTYDGSRIVVRIPRRIRHSAFMGDGYARYTIGHELGHAALHLNKLVLGAALPRRSAGNVTPSWIPKFKSAEHQAMVFGGAFFINDDLARHLSSPEDVSVQAGIFAYLIAALGWRVSSGQSPTLTAGVLNDFTAIATYAPYVDAMFVDRQCASLLKQGRLRSDLSYKARIFSMSNKQEFLDYLRELADTASPEVRGRAHELYGVEP
ncbi:ImmA/IrrE family metallo-endopeptidase [Bradyrhizobium embrapense]